MKTRTRTRVGEFTNRQEILLIGISYVVDHMHIFPLYKGHIQALTRKHFTEGN